MNETALPFFWMLVAMAVCAFVIGLIAVIRGFRPWWNSIRGR